MKGCILSLFLLGTLVSWPEPAFAQNNTPLLNTYTMSSPFGGHSRFGGSVAALGDDRVLVGEGSPAAYLFNLNGTLLTTFYNTDPAAGGLRGALSAVGSDCVIIGAYNYTEGETWAQVGRAYLYTTNGGVFVTVFTNPAPTTVQDFGWSAAPVGADCVVISGLANVSKPPPYPGTVFLIRTNGALLTAFTNPMPAIDSRFGASVACVRGDRVLIGAPYDNRGAPEAGAAYLFSTNGTLLITFTNPVPATNDNFGTAVAAVGNDRVLISAVDDSAVKGTGGAAYLFSTNGTLLTTFTNPTPANFDYFGWSVAAVGSSRVLIGAYEDATGAFQAGVAYLYSTNGVLLNTFTNPTPADYKYFGRAVTAVGSDRVLIGAWSANTTATSSGAAFLYALPYPTLGITRSASTVSVSWVTAETGLVLQQADLLGTSPVWNDTTNLVSVTGLTNVVHQAIANGNTNRFYRLRRP